MTDLYARLKRVLLIVAAILVLALPLMFLLEDFVRDAVVTPMAYATWLVSVIVDALPDAYLLGFGVAVVLYVAVRSLFRDNERPVRSQIPYTPTEGAATTWLRKLRLVTRGSYSEQRLEQQIGQLLLRIVAYENRCSTRDAGQLVQDGEIDLPTELRKYLRAALSHRLPRSPKLLERLKALLSGRGPRRAAGQSITAELDAVLDYVEKELKIRSSEEGRQ